MSQPIYVTFLNGPDIAELKLTDQEILDAIETSLAAQGRGEAVIEPRMHLKPNPEIHGHFNVLRGSLGGEINLAGVKVVSDFASWNITARTRASTARRPGYRPPWEPVTSAALAVPGGSLVMVGAKTIAIVSLSPAWTLFRASW